MNEEEVKKIIEKSKKKIAISQFKKEESMKPKKNILKMVASFVLCVGITMGVVYASVQLESLFRINGMNDKGIQTALANEYVQNIEMDYIEKENVKFKVDYLMMDDINFDLVFNFITKDEVDNYEGIALVGLSITDEENRQIHLPGENQECWGKNISLMDAWWSVVEKHDHLLRQVAHLPSENFPRSQKIYISFDKVVLYNVNKGNPITIEYEDDYKLEFDVSKQLSERKTAQYQAKNQDLVKEVKLTNSGLAISIKTQKYVMRDENYKVMDEAGNVYQLANTYHLVDREKMDYKEGEFLLVFDMTIYNECDKITLKMPYGRKIELTKK